LSVQRSDSKAQREAIIEIAARHRAFNVAVFGTSGREGAAFEITLSSGMRLIQDFENFSAVVIWD
jgi:hypothetical protein